MRIRHKIFIGYMALIAVSVALVVVFLLSLSAINSSYGDLLGSKEQALLQANFLSLQPHPPTFACDAMTGEAVLQCTFPILGATPAELSTVLEDGIRQAHSWRKDFFLAEELAD